MKMVARPFPWWKYSHSSAYSIKSAKSAYKGSFTWSMMITHVRVPVELAQSLGLKLHNSSSNGLGNGKVGGINLAERASLSGNGLRGMVVCVVDIRTVALQGALWFFLEVLADSAIEDVWELLGDLFENRRVNSKVLCKNVLGSVRNPVIDHEGSSIYR